MKEQKNTILAFICLVIAGGFGIYLFDLIINEDAPAERTVMLFYLLTIVGLIFSVLSFKAEEPRRVVKWLVAIGNFILLMIATWAYIMAKVLKAALEG